MIVQEVSVGGKKFRLNLTDQIIMHTKNLKSLYSVAYEDPESFDQVSSEISDAINEISKGVEPPASDSELDGVIQAILDAVGKKSAEVEDAKKAAKKSLKASKKLSSKKTKSRK